MASESVIIKDGLSCDSACGILIQILDDSQLLDDQTQYLCNGANGTNGAKGSDGASSSVKTSVLSVGDANCAMGGVKVDVLVDGEVQTDKTQYICNGLDGSTSDDSTSDKWIFVPAGNFVANSNYGYNLITEATTREKTDQEKAECVSTFQTCIGNCPDNETCYHACEATANTCAHNCADEDFDCISACDVTLDFCRDACDDNHFNCISTCEDTLDACQGPAPVPKTYSWDYTAGSIISMPSFYVMKNLVSAGEFKKCVDDGACSSNNYQKTINKCNIANTGDEYVDYPMNCISYEGAKEYCAWIGGRLITQPEWEYAASYPSKTNMKACAKATGCQIQNYPWGNDEPQHCVHGNYYSGNIAAGGCSLSEEVSRTKGTSSPVGYYVAGNSLLGITDMFGNLAEFVDSYYEYDKFDAPVILIKSGSFFDSERKIGDNGSSTTYGLSTKNQYYGFRCGKDIK